ncbi:MAG TPA: T9SS type A sorting domain-containing protein [Bacteroidales bacterium]|nr:T9SS type A sorting domain-containing protein [Bacteroidales bacterium]
MKTIFFKISWLIFTLINLVNGYSQINNSTLSDEVIYLDPDTCYPGLANGSPSRDQGPETVWLNTGLPISGGIPYDIIYVEDEIDPLNSLIFIYTERKLLTYYMFEYIWGPTIDLTEYGSQTLFKLTQPLLSNSREKHLAYNPVKHELYCLTQDLKILVIDPFSLVTAPIIREIVPNTDIGLLDWAILKYDPVSQYIFLGLCRYHDASEAELMAFNTTDYTFEYSIHNGNLTDVSFNPNPYYSILYLSSNSEIQLRNTLDGSLINSYPMPCSMGVIFNAYNESTGLNKTYCLPKSNIIVEDNALVFTGNNTNPQTKSMAKGNFGCGIYNALSDKVYIGYTSIGTLPSGFISFDPDTENMTDHELTNDDILMDMANLEERVFISTRDHIYCCKNGTNYPDYTLDSPDSYFYRITTTNFFNYPRIWATNLMDQSLQIANAPAEFINLEWYEPEPFSGAALQGFFNHTDQKLYLYYGKRDGDHKFMYIYDPATADITSVRIDHNPTGVIVDEVTNIIYFSRWLDNFIKRYDADGNSWLQPINLPEGFSFCNEMYISDRMLYCVTKINQGEVDAARLLIYNLDEPLAEPEIIDIPCFSPSGYPIVAHYTVDNIGRIYISIRFVEKNQGRVIRINEDFSMTDFGINFVEPDEILYDPLQHRILLKYLESDNISILDFEASPHSYQNFQPREGLAIIDMEIDPISNLVYFDYNDIQQNGYIDIFTTNGIFVKTVQVGYLALALKYNPNNGLMYVHVPENHAADRKEQLWSIDPGTFDVYSMDLGQNEGHWRNAVYLTDLILDEENNKIYSVSAHGNIKIINCSNDQLTLQPGWNWLSYPRLDRSQGAPAPEEVLQQNYFSVGYENLLMTYYNYLWHPTNLASVTWEEGPAGWTYDGLTEVYSERGYKIHLLPEQSRILDLTGTILDRASTFLLYAINPNWIGYFLPITQSPFDAIPEEFLNKITRITGQYWSCFKKDPLPPLKSSGSLWGCACQQGRIELKYGDMITVNTVEEIGAFHWQYGGIFASVEPKAPSLYFQYEEQPAYDAIFIELDTLNLPEEIGAFAGDSCIGATTVLPSDTMALICAYTEGFEGEEITFELLYPTKSARPRCRDYSVLNTTTGIREKRRIVAGENQPYFLVSLKSQENIPADEAAFNVNVRPNPARDEFTVSYFSGEEALVELSLINTLGLPVRSWQRGIQGAGSYSIMISTTGLPSGCYYLKVKAGNAVEIQKIIIIH